MNLDFACTMCGQCCRDLRLPLCVDEALTWLDRGGDVQIICEAVPWPQEPPPEDLQAAARYRRSFAAMSDSLPTRVTVILAGAFTGACPNLKADMRCSIYEQRPLVCRIYPAEVSPFIELIPTRKACPPQAWASDNPPLVREGTLVDRTIATIAQHFRAIDEADVQTKQRLCAYLQIDAAAWANEGYVIYSPERTFLRTMLERAKQADGPQRSAATWRYISNRRTTVEMFASVGAIGELADDAAPMNAAPMATPPKPFEYLGLFSAAG